MKRLVLIILALILPLNVWAQSSKARTFNGTSDVLQSASSINLSADATISFSAWVWFNSDAATQIWFETSADPTTNVGAFTIFQNNSGTTIFQVNAVGGLFCKFHVTDASSGAWHHYLFVVPITTCTSAAVYIDGVSKTVTNDTNNNGTVFGNFTLNVMARNGGASLWTAGRISDIAIWSTALTSGNASTLAACGNPQTVNGTPQFYWPINQTSPEVATDGGVNLTVTGTTNSASNCLGGGSTRGLIVGGGFF